MKFTFPFAAILLFLISTSCEFNQSVKKDLATGAYSRGDGINCDEVSININEELDNRNEFIFGEGVVIYFNDIQGLKKIEGKTYPGMSIYIIKNEKDTVVSNANLLEEVKDGTDLSPLQLHAKFGAIFPYKNDEEYKLFVEIWDEKSDGKFNYELPFTIKENELLEINSKGIKYSQIYLWNESLKSPVFKNHIDSRSELILILDGIEGFDLNQGRAFPTFSIDITDNSGNKILFTPNLLFENEDIGFNPDNLKKQLYAKFNFSSSQVDNPCKVVAKLKDQNSNKELIVETELIVEHHNE
ncbi:hypothetical protein [Brumimicrobium mesophilum]|uniref:hypothetical protein n=1 Tax=Brumimicrobium mesophilum TaxID=392717 RepID=UPI000D13F8BF|nr:hypothetical protein [Brumimicrobium mesophilum]